MRFSLSDTGLDVSVPSVFPSKAIDSVLLTADEVNTTLETYAMSGNERKGVMKVDRSTYGMYASSLMSYLAMLANRDRCNW
jgi:hypothetical protein